MTKDGSYVDAATDLPVTQWTSSSISMKGKRYLAGANALTAPGLPPSNPVVRN